MSKNTPKPPEVLRDTLSIRIPYTTKKKLIKVSRKADRTITEQVLYALELSFNQVAERKGTPP